MERDSLNENKYKPVLITSTMEKREVLSGLIDDKKAKVIQILLNASEEMYLKEISKKANVPIASTFRILHQLVELGIIQRRVWKNSKVYSCHRNEKVDFLRDLFFEEFDGLKEFVKSVKDITSIQSIILHGAKKKGKANILLLGKDIQTDPIDQVCKSLKGKGFELSYLTVTKEQYEQMAKMGLYSSDKRVLK